MYANPIFLATRVRAYACHLHFSRSQYPGLSLQRAHRPMLISDKRTHSAHGIEEERRLSVRVRVNAGIRFRISPDRRPLIVSEWCKTACTAVGWESVL